MLPNETVPPHSSVSASSHSVAIGYVLWLFGFLGAHRFYFGKPITGTLWFCTLGLGGIGWIVDLFLIPAMCAKAEQRFKTGVYDYNVSWLLLTFLGYFGVHRMYLGKWISGIIWFFTGGFFVVGYLYDFWTLNEQVDERNSQK